MIETKDSIREVLCRVLTAELDFYLNANGFTRDKTSLEYVRPCDAGEQVLEMDFDFKPNMEPGASAYIYPWLRLTFPAVNRIALEMVDGVLSLIGAADITLRQPIDFVVPKGCRVRWFSYGREEDYVLCVRSIKGYLEEWVIPFLDKYTTVDSLANYFTNKDDRIPAQRQFYIYVAAAYILLTQPAKAMQVLESNFGKAGPRRDYAKAFQYVERVSWSGES
jgi:hypothetical protein